MSIAVYSGKDSFIPNPLGEKREGGREGEERGKRGGKRGGMSQHLISNRKQC
jgi:hypothetical protein